MGQWWSRWAPTALAVAASLTALAVVASVVFTDFHPTVDHVVYEAQARALRGGSLTLPVDDPGGPLVFTAARDGAAVAKYLPGTALLGAASDLLVGSFGLAPAAALALLVVAVAGIGRTVGLGPWGAAAAAAAAGLSPTVLALDSRLLSYVPGVALGTAAVWSLLEGVRRRRLGLVALAGVVLGAAGFFRQLEPVLWAAAILGWTAAVGLADPTGSRGARAARGRAPLAFAAGLVPGLVGVGLVSWHLTGSPLRPPFVFVSPDDGPGFGLRRALATDPYWSFDAAGGVRAALRGLWVLLPWTAVGAALAVGAVLALVRFRRTPAVVLLGMLGAAVPLAYAAHWSHKNALRGGHYDGVGPFYMLWVLPPMVVLGVLGLRAVRRRGVVAGLVGVAVALQVVVLWNPVGRQLEVARAWASFEADVAALDEPSLVLLEADARGKPFDDLATEEGPVLAVPARTPSSVFAALDRWPARAPWAAVTDLDPVRGRDVLLPSLVALTPSPMAATHRAEVAVGCLDAEPGAPVSVTLGTASRVSVPCGAVVGLELAGSTARLLGAGGELVRTGIAEGADELAVCAWVGGVPGERGSCRRVPVEREGELARWVLPGRLSADHRVVGTTYLLGPVAPTSERGRALQG